MDVLIAELLGNKAKVEWPVRMPLDCFVHSGSLDLILTTMQCHSTALLKLLTARIIALSQNLAKATCTHQHPDLQDFLKEVDIRFMDQLRRGASIVATDLARAPPPASLRECYQLMCLTTPEVDQIEASISTLKEEIDMRKAAVADKETLLANHNPPVFQAVQVGTCCWVILWCAILVSCCLVLLCIR